MLEKIKKEIINNKFVDEVRSNTAFDDNAYTKLISSLSELSHLLKNGFDRGLSQNNMDTHQTAGILVIKLVIIQEYSLLQPLLLCHNTLNLLYILCLA